MSVTWTKEQRQVIDLRGRNILVSAAAGSGKTAVLVERILGRITEAEHPADIDRLLIVTFTNAAAAEMRERISAAIEKALLLQPENEHLQRQLTLIHNAQITTIHSFCLYVIRNHFHETDLEPNFRIGDEGELRLLREDVLKKVLERNYEEAAPAFLALAEGYAPGKSDAALNDMVLSLYAFSRSFPWPDEWLAECGSGYACADEEAFVRAPFLKPLTESIRSVVRDLAALMRRALFLTREPDGPGHYEGVIRSDLEKYETIASCGSFAEFGEALSALVYDRLPSSRGYKGDPAKSELVKALRDRAKEAVKKLVRQYFYATPQVLSEQLRQTAPAAAELTRLTAEFADAFAAEKRRKNLVDFNDLEHFALEILVDGQTKQVKKTAEEFRDAYEEIMIDEYQDSNYVQETILNAVSRRERGEKNIFMVGDVKQSIYRFRLARPELFMEKYETYPVGESDEQRIDLHKNFRSRPQVLSCANDLFRRIMARDLGNVAYDADAALYPGADYPEPDSDLFAPEVLIFDSGDELLTESGFWDKKIPEARMVADRIAALMEEQLVTDKKTGALRPVRYSDIVILLRSLSGWADTFASVLKSAGIPAHAVSATGYFSAVEVQTVLAMLRILDNPGQDIPLAAVLHSPIAGLTEEELAVLRLSDREKSFHDCVLERCRELCGERESTGETPWNSGDAGVQESLDRKLRDFYRMYLRLRRLVPDTPVHELLKILLRETGYGAYAAAMPAGSRRQANLKMLVEKAIAYGNTSYHGLFHFVRYIDELQKYDVDFGEADIAGENENVVRIMSIHKSKGLEFPVVFVCGLGKNFNRQDTRNRMVLHPELGVGLDCVDVKRRVKTPTILKKAIAGQLDLENLGEELRVLYVAITRAKEKLILTGSRKCGAEESAAAAQDAEGVLSYLERISAAGYLDWIMPALGVYGDRYPVQVVGVAQLAAEELKGRLADAFCREACMEQIRNADEALVRRIEDRFSFCYPYQAQIARKNKYSVSELKHRAMREHFEREQEETVPVFAREEIVPYIPSFVRKREQMQEDVNRGALRGTAVHRVMECYQFAAPEPAGVQIAQMAAAGKLSEEMRALVKVSLVEQFAASPLGQRMKRAEAAGTLRREKPFVMGFTPEELRRFGFGEEEGGAGEGGDAELTLIQGIIDVFWEEEDGIVLLDYKTDRVERAGQLADRYAAQLRLYAEALERILNGGSGRVARVKERLLYSFRLGEVVAV